MDFVAKKYTVLMNNEPVDLWLKNGKVKKAEFMQKRIPFELDKKTINLIKDQPAKIVNGGLFEKNKDFTKQMSRVLNQQLKLAIKKNDRMVMSRFARSDLIPKEMEKEFIEAINKKRGIKAVVLNVVNKTNQKIQQLSKKIDRFFDRIADKAANQKLDKHLEKWQQREVNRAAALDDIPREILVKRQDAKLHEMAQKFVTDNTKTWEEIGSVKLFEPFYPGHVEKLGEFIKQGHKQGFTTLECQAAFVQEIEAANFKRHAHGLREENYELEDKIRDFEHNARKNENFSDYEILIKDVKSDMKKLDLLGDNKEYQKLNSNEQKKVEEKYLYQKEPAKERAEELKHLAKDQLQDVAIDMSRDTLQKEWQFAQVESRNHSVPTKKFMDISAVKFGGVNINSLNKWKEQINEMRTAGKETPSVEKVDQFIEGTLKNAQRLQKEGFLKEKEPNVFVFENQEAKKQLYTQVVQGKQQDETKERVKDLSSDKVFEKFIKQDGTIDVEKVAEYAQKLSEIAELAKTQSNVNITRDDLKRDTELVKSHSNEQNQGQQR